MRTHMYCLRQLCGGPVLLAWGRVRLVTDSVSLAVCRVASSASVAHTTHSLTGNSIVLLLHFKYRSSTTAPDTIYLMIYHTMHLLGFFCKICGHVQDTLQNTQQITAYLLMCTNCVGAPLGVF